MTTPGKRIKIGLLATFVLALYVGQPMAADNEQEQRQMFKDGARLWPVYCAQCHNARPGSEFSPAQWDAILMHMRTLPNLPAKDARAILVYLKASH
jgi:mono/diheme cytochrome c family protein